MVLAAGHAPPRQTRPRRPPTLLLFVLLPWIGQAGGWVTLPSDYDKWEGRKYAWTFGSEAVSMEGLRGGLAFAIDPRLCAELRPTFREDSVSSGGLNLIEFINCEEINDAIARAMSTWALNHPYLDFYNVTDECNAEGKGRECSLAEVYIDASAPAPGSKFETIAAYVIHNPSWRKYSGDRWERGVRTPAGAAERGRAHARRWARAPRGRARGGGRALTRAGARASPLGPRVAQATPCARTFGLNSPRSLFTRTCAGTSTTRSAEASASATR